MSDQKKAHPADVVEIAETGDGFLVTSPEKLKLRVQSLMLKTFAAMWGQPGQRVANNRVQRSQWRYFF